VVLFSACDVLCAVSYLVEWCFKALSAAYRCYVCRTLLKGPQHSVCALDIANGVGCELGQRTNIFMFVPGWLLRARGG